ncbi:hypothetical protein BGW36DRAFT_175808 [Talaromyces proteolyticus]|uniref:Uncharacterized protein n=1 Tax=Talaromyces proteolyticus TaxID=1131652 RepID=A0AAD4KRR9_9EURO|nr:uncharacterized protein BGW36DRAFT_175808 [Talaromyces proteolyticus]KAH8697805.1 hypothetical protein BGW36DRAFT_175808 [Talaromyces proteolyticus]
MLKQNVNQLIDTNIAPASNPPTAGTGGIPSAAPTGGLKPITRRKTDRNMTDSRLLANRKCIYERRLPGGAYITAHLERLQHGYFGSENTSDHEVSHVDFLGVNFVFHPSDCDNHRFKAATIRATIQNATVGEDRYPYPQENPKFLMHAPHLIYGAVSPETLQWTFSLAGSLGISDAPVAASLSPTGSRAGSYKVYEMMKIQGSSRTFKSPDGPEFDVEDGEILWSLSENALQRSGLPREFTFVMLVEKPRADSQISFKLEIDPLIDAWYGSYPSWWINKSAYQPLRKRAVNFHGQVGQRFTPVDAQKGFNFAKLASNLDDYVNMPGSTYSSNVSPDGVYNDPTGTQPARPNQPTGSGNGYGYGSGGNMNDQPIRIPEYYGYPETGQPYGPLIRPPQDVWGMSSPFQRGWPRQDTYYGGPSGYNGRVGTSTESTINVKVMLENGFTSQLAAAALGNQGMRASPRLRDSPTLGISAASEGSPMGRTRSLRRSRSREDLNKTASTNRRMTVATDASIDPEYHSTEPISNGTGGVRKTSEAMTISDINVTPPPDGIRDPLAIKKTTNGSSRRTTTVSGSFDDTYIPNGNLANGIHTPSPASNGTLRPRQASSGQMPRRSASQKTNGYRNRYSYPSALQNDLGNS